ncbi:MAG: hypothetical protein JWO12_1916 [Frankiales bacterium]|nr:hypothetical protein [Frankiales bacterium]
MQVTRRGVTGLTATVGCTTLLVLSLSMPVRAAGSRSFQAVAAADGVREQVVSPGAPLTDTVVDTGGPTAQARLTSVGSSTGFAAYPDPGATVLGAPSTAGTSAVSYPAAVTSSYPVTPEAKQSTGPYSLAAHSRQDGSDAAASSGSAEPNAALLSAQARVELTGDRVTATAASDDRSLATGPLSVGRVRAIATVTLGASGPAKPSSTFDVEGLSAGGTSFGIGPGGLTIAGTTTPLPDASPVTSVLDGAGISVRYLEPTTTPTGAVSAGLQITVGDPKGQHTTYVLGQASARVTQTVTEDAFVPPPALPPPPVDVPSAAPTSPDLPGVAPVQPSTAVVPPPVTATVAPPVSSATSPPLVLARAEVNGWPRSFFLVLSAGGLLALVLASLFSFLGVRRP